MSNKEKLHHGGIHGRACGQGTCHHTDALECIAGTYRVDIEFLFEAQKCDCPCHGRAVKLTGEGRLTHYEYET